MAGKLYSNPFSEFVDGSRTAEYTFEPKGDIPFCVRFSQPHWIPVNVLVFSDTPENAIKQVEEGLRFIADVYHRDQESNHPCSVPRYEKQVRMAAFLDLSRKEAERITPNQVFKIGWASNDRFGI